MNYDMQTNPPVEWQSLKKALEIIDSELIQRAIVVQLLHRPSADVYKFLTRTLDLCLIGMHEHYEDKRQIELELNRS